MIETVLTGGTIVDGTGRPRFTTDIGIVGDRIALIGDLSSRDAVFRIDCRGAVIAPGFVDACSHTDEGWLTLPRGDSKILQGVTTEIGGNCGKSALQGEHWAGADEFLAAAAQHGVESNVATLAGYAEASRGTDAGAAILRACEGGALGVSLDLCDTPADAAVAAMTAARDGGAPRATVHLRDDGNDVVLSVDEAIDIARRANVALHISHHRVQRIRRANRMEQTLERIDRARARGIDVTCDLYPYVTTSIDLASLLPQSIRERDGVLDWLADPDATVAVAMEMQARLGERWHDIMLAQVSGEAQMAWCGMRIDEIARARRLSPARTLIELIRQDRTARAFFFTLHEDDIAMLLSAGFAMIGSNDRAYASTQTFYGNPHPRAFGTFARIIGRFVRQRRVLSLEEAVRRMSGLPARTFGLERRGEIMAEHFADLVVFDEAEFMDTATYERAVTPARGIRHVFVNGVAAVSAGAVTNARRGRSLRGGR